MKKIFWENPYKSELETKVVAISPLGILFEETIAFSFCGGQESDKAFINGLPVLHSQMDGNLIYYRLPENHGLAAGDKVFMHIDWQRRYRLMRLHFAAELVLELVVRRYHLEKVGAHISEEKARIDFIYPEHISCLFDQTLSEYNKIIDADLPIETGFTDVATQRRYWKIEGFAQVACGGTHVKSTKEVGYITLKRSRSAKGVERIEIRLSHNS